jgi:hypothetical protein
VSILRKLRAPAPEYVRLLAMLDYNQEVYADWLRANVSRLTEMMDHDGVSPRDDFEAVPWLRALFIHEHWFPTSGVLR